MSVRSLIYFFVPLETRNCFFFIWQQIILMRVESEGFFVECCNKYYIFSLLFWSENIAQYWTVFTYFCWYQFYMNSHFVNFLAYHFDTCYIFLSSCVKFEDLVVQTGEKKTRKLVFNEYKWIHSKLIFKKLVWLD